MVAGDLRLVIGHDARPLGARADDAHFAAEDVEYLRQLVESDKTEKPPHAGHTRVVVARVRIVLRFANTHGAELEQGELLFAAPDALLPEKDGETAVDQHGDGNQRHERQSDREDGEGQEVIHAGFEVAVGGMTGELEVLTQGPVMVEAVD